MGLFNTLFGRGGDDQDGSSPEKAIVVGSVAEEYAWIQRHCSGFQFERQAVGEIGGKHYDVMTLRNSEGESRTVFFDISGFYGQ